MTVYFVGAGPGAADLLTIRGRDVIARCPVCLYAGSLVPDAVISWAPEHARVTDTAALTLPDIVALMHEAHNQGHDVARIQSGDPALYGAIAEQMRALDRLDIPYEVVPGVPAFTAAAAALKTELTAPTLSQTVIITRVGGKSSAMPDGEDLATLAQAGATLALHLSIRHLRQIERELIPVYGAECPVVVAYRVSWPDEMILRGTLSTIRAQVRAAGLTRTALILVGQVLTADTFPDSALYDPEYRHLLRPI